MESSSSNEKGYVRSIRDAVEAINKLYPPTQPRSSAFLWTFWDSLLMVAKRIPYNDDPKQNLLVDFLTNLHQKTIGTVSIGKDIESRVWRDLPLLDTTVREEWCSPAMDGNIPTPKESSEWLNLNSFTARMTSEGLIDGSILGLWVIRFALEEENAAGVIANSNISVASEWIIRSGIQLYSEVLHAGPLDACQRTTMGGSLYDGEVGFCRERWEFWKLRLSMGNTDDMDEDVAKMVQQALRTMGETEKVMGKRDMVPFTSRASSSLEQRSPRTDLKQKENKGMEKGEIR
ncbi:Protein of unknown function (DUF3632) domain containing protein [Elaphomyces granulatus]